ncbi:hypothetical protein P7C70_g6552, partial [Phenoliferia sp. Uapishka_3]
MSPAPYVIPPFPYADLLEKGPFNDWRDDLARDGYVVVPNVISADKAKEYRTRAFDWVSSFGRGFDHSKPETYGQEFMPKYNRGGMMPAYGIHHEQWVWDIRCEPGVKAAFAKLWGTDKLVSSFDTAAIMLPGPPKPPSADDSWHHIDLNPSRKGFFVAQGLVNLNENGPDDGGLAVMKGSSKLMKEFFDVHGRPPVPPEGAKLDTYGFTVADKDWFFARGCEWLKVCAGPGDLILWDSSCMHQGNPPKPGGRDRVITYVCMGPAHLVSEKDRAVRTKAWDDRKGTSHPPFGGPFEMNNIPIREETGKPDPDIYARKNSVKVTDDVLRLAGILDYE